ncbi:hypothetical protein L484_017722 [Morus notabilis]|uniref:Uncharacterized protein n=1 Tax=Morus notabilis TaxID=981085 RepID=W9SJW7_9ROSA|nr:hypothetical protein L484_017722 [Morus notabilis]
MKLRQHHSAKEMSDKSIMERVLGCEFLRFADSSSHLIRPTYDELLAELNAINSRLHDVEGGLDEFCQVLRANSLMPPPPKPKYVSDADLYLNSEQHDDSS